MKKYIILASLIFSTLVLNVYSQIWTTQTSGTTTALNCVSAVNDDVAWISGDFGKVLKTTNKGVNWINVSSNLPVSFDMYSIFAWDANIALVTGNSGGIGGTTAIYRTSNGGANWVTAVSRTGLGYDLWMTSASNAYYIGYPISGYWDLLCSTNSGLNWSTWSLLPATGIAESSINGAWFQDQQVWFGSTFKIYYSSNMGVNWSIQTIPIAYTRDICFNTAAKGMAYGGAGTQGLLLTTNAGVNWTQITDPFSTFSGSSGICGTQSTWWISQGGVMNIRGVSVSTNDGLNWATAYTAPDGTNNHMTKSRSGFTIWLVRDNGGISRYGTPIVSINQNSNEIPSSYSLSQNYPNPFNPETRINFSIPKQGLVNLGIYNILGKEVKTLVNEVKAPGSYSVDFDGTEMSSGVYFYKIESNGFTDMKKMILIK
jgi:photosystem II stability/assembly factor-like uncharacterized protein